MLGPLRGRVDNCWLFRGLGCGLLAAVLKEETKGKKLDSGIFFPPNSSPPSIPVALLSINGGETREIKGGKK